MNKEASKLTLKSKWMLTPAGRICSRHDVPARWTNNRARESGGQWTCPKCDAAKIKSRRDGWKATRDGQLRYYLREQFWAAKSTSRRICRDFTITLDDVVGLWERQGGCCAITGDAMELVPSDRVRNPQKFSLDRIDSTRGYTPDNVQYLCEWANRAKQNLSQEQLVKFATGILRNAAKSSNAE